MNTDEIRAALAAATPGPWHAWDRGIGYEVHEGATHGESNGDSAWCRELNNEFRETFRSEDAHLIANTPTWLAELLAEVDRLREEARAFAEALGFGNGSTEPAATLAQMIDPLTEAMSMARDHIECAAMCELCGEVLAGEWCEECHGSGCLPNAELAYLECGTCAGVGRIHVGCAEASYAELAARAEAAEKAVRRVREFAEQGREFADRTMDDAAAHWARSAADGIIRALDGGDPT